MKELKESIEIEREEKQQYLHSLDSSLKVLEERLGLEKEGNFFIRDFGIAKGWEWTRLPEHSRTYQKLARLVERVRQDYSWFGTKIFDDSRKNRGYFEKTAVSTRTGLPWQFDIIELKRLRENAAGTLEKMPSYDDYVRSLKELLMTDNIPTAQVAEEAEKVQREAMKRNFFEQLQNAQLIGRKDSADIEIEKIRPEGSETLWNISFVKYSTASSLFELYVFDLWQDISATPEIIEDEKETRISQSLRDRLQSFSSDNESWYILERIDEEFENLHPVHVSRMLVGPFENKYLANPTYKPLAVTQELLNENDKAALLRFSRSYTYAPNHEEKQGKVRQTIYREKWTDEGIVCPSQYSARVSKAVSGTKLRIFEVRI